MPRFHEWNVSGDITAAYTVTPDVHAHATYAGSYKSGGINLSSLPLDGANNPILPTATVESEKVNHYELGLKTQSTDHRLTLDVAAFWTKIGNYQATVDNQQLNVIRGYLANADKVRTRGIEIDSAFRPICRFDVYANGAYTDAKYVRFRNAPCPSLSNVRPGFRKGDNLDVFGWVRNALDKDYYEVLATQSGSTGPIIGQPGDPRLWPDLFQAVLSNYAHNDKRPDRCRSGRLHDDRSSAPCLVPARLAVLAALLETFPEPGHCLCASVILLNGADGAVTAVVTLSRRLPQLCCVCAT